MTDNRKWIFHSMPFGINIASSAFSYGLTKVLAPCSKFALNFLDDIMIFSRTWEEHLKHLKSVIKQLEAADMKIKCSKCEFFKTKLHYLGFLVGINGVQPLPEKVARIQALAPSRDINELRQFSGLEGFYRRIIPFFTDITIYLNKGLRKGGTFNWTEEWRNAFKYLKAELSKCKPYNIQILIKLSNYLQIHLNTVTLEFSTKSKKDKQLQRNQKLIPIAYFPGTFDKTHTALEHYTKGMLHILQISSKISFCLTGTDCTLYCNHKPLTPFFTTGMSNHVLDQ